MGQTTLEKFIIDMKTWDRREAYYIFKTFDIPYTNLCSDIDITRFMKFIRTKDYRFYAALLFYITKAANIIKEFRCRLEGDTPVIWNQIGANYTLLQNSGVIGNNYTDFTDNLEEFYDNVMNDLEAAKKSGHMINKKLPGNAVVTITSIPWTRLSNFSQAMFRTGDAVPYIGIGRRYGQDERIKLPLAVQAHHAFVDGFHIAHYFSLLETLLSDPERYTDGTVSYDQILKDTKPFILSDNEKAINF